METLPSCPVTVFPVDSSIKTEEVKGAVKSSVPTVGEQEGDSLIMTPPSGTNPPAVSSSPEHLDFKLFEVRSTLCLFFFSSQTFIGSFIDSFLS